MKLIINLLTFLVFLPQLRANCFPRSSRLRRGVTWRPFFQSCAHCSLRREQRTTIDNGWSLSSLTSRSWGQPGKLRFPPILLSYIYLDVRSMHWLICIVYIYIFYEVSKSVLDIFIDIRICNCSHIYDMFHPLFFYQSLKIYFNQ